MDTITRLERAVEQTRPIVAAMTDDQLHLPTPCTEWTVKELVNHTIGALVMFRDAADRGEVDLAAVGADHVAAGALDTYDQVAKEAVEALRAKGTDSTIKLPFGELPAEFAYQLIADDVLVHGWDLARATGQQIEWDQELAGDTLAFVRAGLSDPNIRGNQFDSPVQCPSGADPMTQLVAYLGRIP